MRGSFKFNFCVSKPKQLGHVGQSVTCLTADRCLTADPGVTSLIPSQSHNFAKIDHEIISTTIFFSSADSRRVVNNN